MPGRTQNVSQHVFTKSTLCQLGYKMHLNMCCPKPTHASKDIKCISICFDQNYPMSARTQNVSQHAFIKSTLCQLGHKMHLNKCCPKPTHASKDIKCISTCIDQTLLIPAKTQNVSQHFGPKTSHANEDTKASQLDSTNPLPCHPCQREHQMHQHLLTEPIPFQQRQKCISTRVD